MSLHYTGVTCLVRARASERRLNYLLLPPLRGKDGKMAQPATPCFDFARRVLAWLSGSSAPVTRTWRFASYQICR
jgi:hypothetical protein